MEINNFNKIRNAYIKARATERTKLVELLRENQYTVITHGRAGQGNKNYSGSGKLNPPYDLSHHKWIDAQKAGVNFLISFNPLEVDGNTANPHHLYDRIGVQAYIGNNTETDIRTAMIITKWTLPITKSDGEELIAFLNTLIEMFKVWQKLHK